MTKKELIWQYAMKLSDIIHKLDMALYKKDDKLLKVTMTTFEETITSLLKEAKKK